ncbi:MAG TPA: hypothetical protein VL335_00930 [Candidatus Paceibacterota bacterium]|nr:hypothetical protein [Candidatus Paceibacterota bacterium]
MKKFFVITALIGITLGVSSNSFGQTLQTYNQTCARINVFESFKYYFPETATPMISDILAGVVNDNCVYPYPSLKYRLVGRISKGKIIKQANATYDPIEGRLFYLLYISKQVTGPRANLSDKALVNLTKDGGVRLVGSVRRQWAKKLELNNGFYTDTLQDYNTNTAAVLVDVIAQPYWVHPAKIPELTVSTPAGQALWQVYYDIRLVELAKRSVAVKLLNDCGVICIPTVTYAGTRPIYLDPVGWSQYDIPGLQRIIADNWSDPWFCNAARAKLQSLSNP